MKILFITSVLISITLITSCATKTSFYWEKVFESNVSQVQAEAQCGYENQLQLNADNRSGIQKGAIQIYLEMSPDTNPTIQSCMYRFGYKPHIVVLDDGKK